MNTPSIYGVILAGGKGERLWPLSREALPKQFLEIQKKSLLKHTYDRLIQLISPEKISIVTTQAQSALIEHHIPTVNLIVEPFSKNTAPALLLSCLTIAQQDPQAVVLFCPADHYISDQDAFLKTLQQAIAQSHEAQQITLIGIEPTYAATGYGYIEFDVAKAMSEQGLGTSSRRSFNEGGLPIIRFHEKPSAAVAQEYIELGNMLWNIGIFCAPVSVFIEAYKKYAPELYTLVYNYFKTGSAEWYQQLESISVDYALMEKSSSLLVIPAQLGWSDVGNLATFLSLEADTHNHLSIESINNLVLSQKPLTVLIGVEDLVVVQTDDVLLIAKRSESEKVKLALNELRKNNKQEYL